MSSTTLPARAGWTTTRAAVSTGLAAMAAVAVAAAVVTGLTDTSPARPAPAPTGNGMPTPQWLEGYLAPQVAGDEDPSLAPQPGGHVNRGLR